LVNVSSAAIIDAQQDELLRAYKEYQALSRIKDQLRAENLNLKEQVTSRDNQLKDKDEELTRLKSFIRHYTVDSRSTVSSNLLLQLL
jgi:dynactin complex subunit